MVLYPNKLPESERVCSGICTEFCLMKNKYGFSWQDMILITDFWQTVEIQY